MAQISRLSIIKFLELAIAVTCIGLHYKSVTGDFNIDTLSVATFGGYIIILVGGFVGHVITSPIGRRIDVFYCIVGCALFIAVGALNINFFQGRWRGGEYRDYGLAKASLAIINGVLFLLDSLLTWRGDY